MGSLFDAIFQSQPFPAVLQSSHLPGGILSALREAYRLVYLRGVYDGFVAGAILTVILLPRCRWKP